jgi:hypothetical protein
VRPIVKVVRPTGNVHFSHMLPIDVHLAIFLCAMKSTSLVHPIRLVFICWSSDTGFLLHSLPLTDSPTSPHSAD